MCDNKPMAPYAKLPELEEYKEWFKDFADLYREDGILQVTWKTNDGPMHHSGMSHRAIGQLVRVLSLDFKNEIIIFTHIGDNWMTESDPNGWETYSELPTQRFQHQYFDDTNLIKNMVQKILLWKFHMPRAVWYLVMLWVLCASITLEQNVVTTT